MPNTTQLFLGASSGFQEHVKIRTNNFAAMLLPESFYHCPNAHYTIVFNINVPEINFACTGVNA
jgi:hypothetical protein